MSVFSGLGLTVIIMRLSGYGDLQEAVTAIKAAIRNVQPIGRPQ